MANPAPIISQINAFNATEGTIISFNIVGGTSIVRSNIIYIYDLSDNSLICTHLYISTESIHELPANTDPSIVYASGKSSADFTNGKQYYAQIQTFTNTAGTEGASGASIAKLFWCLVDPTFTINTIPSSISTTSYNVGAVYNSNTTATSNIVQQYQFNLYSATGVLVQSSGVITGSGAQQGTSTAYDLSYNFTGLNVGSSYYVTAEVTTTQGMTVSAQSSTFTVSIDTPTLGEATVVNNACDGYISVTSNLSGEYGGSASGEIASFVTSSINDISSLKVSLEPIQDLHGYDKPWVGGAGKNKIPYPYNGNTSSQNGVTVTVNNDGTITLNGTATATTYLWLIDRTANIPLWLKPNTEYVVSGGNGAFNSDGKIQMILYGSPSWTLTENKDTTPADLSAYTHFAVVVQIANGSTYSNKKIYPQIELGSTATSYEPYSNICPISGWDSVDVSVASGQLIDTSTNQSGAIDASGNEVANATFNRTDFIPIDKARICVKTTLASGYVIRVHGYSASKAWVQQIKAITTDGTNMLVEEDVPSGVAYVRVSYPLVGVDNTELWQADTIATTLPQTVYGGTLDVVSGVLTVDRAIVTLDGSQEIGLANWRPNETSVGWLYRAETFSDMWNEHQLLESEVDYIKSDKLPTVKYTEPMGLYDIGTSAISIVSGFWSIGVRINDTTLTTKDAINSYLASNPIQVCYKLATPQTYQLTPQQIQTLLGQNNVWSEQQGEIELSYHIPITNLLVKRQDVDDVSGNWLTLYSQPITQASDMDFTFIDFTNQYGKTYKYALVPLLTQEQSGVEVEVEGGYTVSDEVVSIFDGVFVADNTAIYKLKAGVNYGDLSKVQEVGSINTIGSKYPIIVSNSKVDYRTASLSTTIVADDYYNNGNLNRMDMVQKRELMESFFTNKRAKILKDWNGNIWLVVFIDNVNITFINEYGMGIATLTATWTEIGDVTSEEDLQNTRIINVG